MESLIWLLPAVACPLMMVLMMWVMGKGMGMGKGGEAARPPSVDDLRAEQQRLAAQIDRVEQGNGHRSATAERTEPSA